MMYNPSKQVWFNPNIEYIFGDEIIEYDMRDAGFNIIKEYKLLPDNKIFELTQLGKGIERHIAIGKLQGSDKEFAKRFNDKFTEVRYVFIDSNKLGDDRIISVKKDAIFTIGKCSKLVYGNIRFAEKNSYSSYVRFTNIANTEIYYSSDQVDVKGLGDSSMFKHRLYMLEFITKVISMIEERNPYVKRFVMNFVTKYKSRSLDDEYYVKFDRMSKDVDLLFNYREVIIPLIMMIMKEMPE